ncbi:MAG: alpha/beta hydrolase [Myxococcales bacterium]|nr:alpha/beta hydrolase [Myxococcales bacterium]
MRQLVLQPAPTARDLEKIPFKSLYVKEIYDVPTPDGWVLQISRYRPVPQAWEQPIFGEPLLLVPGWSQNRHAFTCGDFVKQLLAFGADVHILELRGHGMSSRQLQIDRAARDGRNPPADIDWGWDLDSYFLHDVPAGVAAVKARTGRARIFYLGASMGGMLGYGYAGCHDDLAGLVAIGAPSDIGRGFLALRAMALFGPALVGPLLDAAAAGASSVKRTRYGAARLLRMLRPFARAANLLAAPDSEYKPVRFNHVPVDAFLRALASAATENNLRRYESVARYIGFLLNPARVTGDDFRWLLSQGGEKEPRLVVEQFARWIRHDEMKCYRNGYDYKAHFRDIRIPMAIFFGDLDRIASRHSTRGIYHSARSEYLVWRPVSQNHHLELTMGHDIHEICEDVRDLVEYATRKDRAKAV